MTGNNLLQLRQACCLSQTALANHLSVNVKTIQRWESGETPISTVAEIAIRQVLRPAAAPKSERLDEEDAMFEHEL